MCNNKTKRKNYKVLEKKTNKKGHGGAIRRRKEAEKREQHKTKNRKPQTVNRKQMSKRKQTTKHYPCVDICRWTSSALPLLSRNATPRLFSASGSVILPSISRDPTAVAGVGASVAAAASSGLLCTTMMSGCDLTAPLSSSAHIRPTVAAASSDGPTMTTSNRPL